MIILRIVLILSYWISQDLKSYYGLYLTYNVATYHFQSYYRLHLIVCQYIYEWIHLSHIAKNVSYRFVDGLFSVFLPLTSPKVSQQVILINYCCKGSTHKSISARNNTSFFFGKTKNIVHNILYRNLIKDVFLVLNFVPYWKYHFEADTSMFSQFDQLYIDRP